MTEQPALRAAQEAYDAFADRGLKLDITRGKPGPEQLDLAAGLLDNVTGSDFLTPGGTDVRNYGGFDGLPELREIFSPLLLVPAGQLLAQGNSSLTLMQQVLMYACLHGLPDSPEPWSAGPRKFLCPVPGYDRHFGLTESLGFELIGVPCDDEGPDMDEVRKLVAGDPAIKGIWLVPLYSNPSGVSISEARTRELLELRAAAPDFLVMWDNAYGVHHFREPHDTPIDVLALANSAGHPRRVVTFASTSKITLAGSGVSFIGADPALIDWFRTHGEAGSIGPDKVNQLRHLRFFGDADGVRAHMAKHAALIEPKFAAVESALEAGLAEDPDVHWTRPRGGYFITLRVRPGTASLVVKLAAEAGVKLTPAGATHPYGLDAEDSYIRIAPTMPSLHDVRLAAEGLVSCIRLAQEQARLTE